MRYYSVLCLVTFFYSGKSYTSVLISESWYYFIPQLMWEIIQELAIS